MSQISPSRHISSLIASFRGHRVILDSDLAALYGVTVKRLNQQVVRNKERFPEDFMFQLTEKEWNSLRLQNATLKRGQHRKYMPYVFTEHGAIMAATVLNSPQAVQMSMVVVRAFVKLRRMALSVEQLHRKVDALERGFKDHGQNFKAVFNALRQLMTPPPEKPKPKIGFHP
ncbi:MAG: ORF6N domain-containing protein [Verrucomicrobiae bacterium]|nr:ORF6N domain-containing protein [Verrucomicrobiae bacterium]